MVNILFVFCMRDENWAAISSRAICCTDSRELTSRGPWSEFVDGKVEGEVSRDASLGWCCVGVWCGNGDVENAGA